MKHFKLLASAMIISALSIASTNVVSAAATSAEQILQCTLGTYVDITPDSSATLKANIDVETGNLDTPLTSIFTIKANERQKLYLSARTQSETSDNVPAFFQNSSGEVCVALAHLSNLAQDSAITNAKSSAPVADDNKNVIAYKVTGVEMNGPNIGADPVFKPADNRYEIDALAGETTATTTISSNAVANTYSFLDTAGVYQAIVTLTTSAT